MGAPDPHLDQSFNDVLLKTLVNEKEKHRVARLALDTAQTQIVALSAENKTLKVSKILLETIVKKNRARQSVPSIEKQTQLPIQRSILYDTLAQQREIYEAKGYPEINEQDKQLFDLSLVPPNCQDTATFRHFLDEETVEDKPPHAPPPLPLSEQDTDDLGSKLVDILPPSQQPTSKPKPTPTVAEAVESCHRALETVNMSQTMADMDRPPTLQLPVDFLAKYRPAKKTPMAVVEELPEEDIPVQIDFLLPAKTTPVMVIDEPLKVVPIQTKAPTDSVLPAVRLPVLDTNIKWAMNSLVPAFDDEDQIRGQNKVARTPIVYPTSGNILFAFYQIRQRRIYVLEHVRTGALESVELFPPLRGCTDYFTARVVFTYEIPAVTMVMQYQKRVSQGDPIKIKGRAVRFWQVLQPTYPASKQLEDDIFQDGYTRILLLENVENSGILPKLHEKLAPEMRNGSVIKIWRTADGVPMVEFTSVAAATGAFRRLRVDREFKGCVFDFDRDYCEDEY